MFLLCFRVGRKCSHYAEFIWEQVHVTICCDETEVDLILLIIKAGVLVLRCKFNILEGYLYVYIAYIKTMWLKTANWDELCPSCAVQHQTLILLVLSFPLVSGNYG